MKEVAHKTQEPASSRVRVLAALLVLLLLLMLAMVWLATRGQARPLRPDDTTARHEDDRAETRVRPKPRPENSAQDVPPGPQPTIGHPPPDKPAAKDPAEPPLIVALPPLTPFRRLVMEADNVLELQGLDGARDPSSRERLRRVDAVLQALKSVYATYSGVRLKREFTADERQELAAGVKQDFQAPDVHTPSFKMDKGPRVQLWLRDKVALPRAENPARVSPGARVPYARRLHEDVSPRLLEQTLEAIEKEFGISDIGRDSRPPLDMVVFAGRATFADFSDKRLNLAAPEWSVGFFAPKWEVVCAPSREDVCLAEVLRHEMFHAYQWRVAPESIQCPWFSEGTAEWLDKAAPKTGRLGTLEPFRDAACGYLLSLLDAGLPLELEKFLAANVQEFYQRPELNYLLAYCFVDFLYNTPDLKQLYSRFWKLMVEGAMPSEAHKETFGRLDAARLETRFLEYLRKFRRHYVPVRFSFDAPAGTEGLQLPERLSGGLSRPPADGSISAHWYEVLGRLADAGFVYEGPPLPREEYDHVVIAIDSSASMQQPYDWRMTDQDAFLYWITALSVAPRIKLSRQNAPEPAPLTVLALLVQTVLAEGEEKAREFGEISGISVDKNLVLQIEKEYGRITLESRELVRGPKRAMLRWMAEYLVGIWAKSGARISVVDFNYAVKTATDHGDKSMVRKLIDHLSSNAGKTHQQGADTDWQLALSRVLQPAWHDPGARTAVLFMTDGPNSAGVFGHAEANRDNKRYLADVGLLAAQAADEFKDSGLDAGKTLIQFMALPGAQDQGLDLVAAALPGGRLDEWTRRFAKK